MEATTKAVHFAKLLGFHYSTLIHVILTSHMIGDIVHACFHHLQRGHKRRAKYISLNYRGHLINCIYTGLHSSEDHNPINVDRSRQNN